MLFDPGSLQTGDKRTAIVMVCVKACPLGTGAMAQGLKVCPALAEDPRFVPRGHGRRLATTRVTPAPGDLIPSSVL